MPPYQYFYRDTNPLDINPVFPSVGVSIIIIIISIIIIIIIIITITIIIIIIVIIVIIISLILFWLSLLRLLNKEYRYCFKINVNGI